MKKTEAFFSAIKIPVDFFSAILAFYVAKFLRPISDFIPGVDRFFPTEKLPTNEFFWKFAAFSALTFVIILIILGHFSFRKNDFFSDFPRIFFAAIFSTAAIISFFAIVRHQLIFSRLILFHAAILEIFFTVFAEFFLRKIKNFFFKKGIGVSKICLIAEKNLAINFSQKISLFPEFLVTANLPQNYLQTEKTQKKQKINFEKFDEIWNIEKISPETEKKWRQMAIKNHKIFRFFPTDLQHFSHFEIEILAGIPLLRVIPEKLSGWNRIFKRILDHLLATIFLIILSPVFLLLAIGVKISSSGSIFFVATRIGKNGKPFKVYKFRSMISEAEKMKKKLIKKNHRDGPFFKIKNDPRITKFGRFLRRFSLDELPQIWNVFLGEMSLVGPRPHLPEEIDKFPTEFRNILTIRPGITGISQTSGRSNLKFIEEMKLDFFYLQNWSFWLDFKILTKTIFVALSGHGAD